MKLWRAINWPLAVEYGSAILAIGIIVAWLLMR